MYEWLLAIHVLAAGLWFGSGLAVAVVMRRTLAAHETSFPDAVSAIDGWASKAHPLSGLVLLLTGPAMVADADISFGEPWVIIALAGLILLFAIGGGLIARTAKEMKGHLEQGGLTAPARAAAQRLLTYMAIESLILGLVIVDMVVKPGA